MLTPLNIPHLLTIPQFIAPPISDPSPEALLEATLFPSIILFSDLGTELWKRVKAADPKKRKKWSKKKARNWLRTQLESAVPSSPTPETTALGTTLAEGLSFSRRPTWQILPGNSPGAPAGLGVQGRISDSAADALLAFLVDTAGIVVEPPLERGDLPVPFITVYFQYASGTSAFVLPRIPVQSADLYTVAPRLEPPAIKTLLERAPALKQLDWRKCLDPEALAQSMKLDIDSTFASAAALASSLPRDDFETVTSHPIGDDHGLARALVVHASALGIQTRLFLDPVTGIPVRMSLFRTQHGNDDPSVRILCRHESTGEWCILLRLGPSACDGSLPPSSSSDQPPFFLGSLIDSCSAITMAVLGIDAVINVCSDGVGIFGHRANFSSLHIPLDDTADQDLSHAFEAAPTALAEARGDGKTVLLHCVVGKSRSVSIGLAYLMAHKKTSLAAAFDILATHRPFICPNSGFQTQLDALEASLFPDASGDVPSMDWASVSDSAVWGERASHVELPDGISVVEKSRKAKAAISEEEAAARAARAEAAATLNETVDALLTPPAALEDFVQLWTSAAGELPGSSSPSDETTRVRAFARALKSSLRFGLVINDVEIDTDADLVQSILALAAGSSPFLVLRHAIHSSSTPSKLTKLVLSRALSWFSQQS